jgi:2-polyprenyl-3-methyl-5-hydroxy-6-metoxy-1,4-benzoquinol methylase
MTAGGGCGICGGPTELLHPGASAPPRPEELAPTNHRLGGHGDLYSCRECGTVSQPSLPGGEELRALYRRMNDRSYLDEEPGRRRTARRLLAMLERRVSPGRLLDVGCGHGLLLDEARARGWDVVGLDLSAAAAAHGREALGLDVRETPLEHFRDEPGFDALVLADVIEHTDDPPLAVDRCFELLRPGGVALFATPDPASRMARLTADRWWGYLRAHAYLLPRPTMARLLAARGFEPVATRPLVRTFSAGYWLAGARERQGVLGTAAGAAARVVPGGLPLSLTLRDEYVLLVRRPAGARSRRAPATSASAASITR